MNTQNYGIDYGYGQTNVDKSTGIRFGVIPHHDVLQAWADSSEPDYGPPTCPKCGNQADEPGAFGDTFKDGLPDDFTTGMYGQDDYVCIDCRHAFGPEDAYGDEPIGFYHKVDGYSCRQYSGDCDILIVRSPYYTHALHCSPCAPGACYLRSPVDTRGPRAYCLGHDWFDGGIAPYPVYSAETGKLVPPPVQP